ncbi:YfcE family phosphodiesterase [Thermotalea metallivorans]|uniref:Phosphoesterase n=1 Tax=Thermotalea metallivorans TaxID=520762 RepID=A0A140L7I4_9FIRM|nr:metallophosphoesterase [Thermotalea metallivorans]KXG76509.1 Phosphodiesterase YfcE [Thermotalea metallivorans]
MRLGVISDTHGAIRTAERAIKQMGKVDLLVHLGDYYEDGMKLRERIGVPLIGVKGNCDFYREGEEEIIREIEGHKIYMIHGHQYDVKRDLNRLYYRALELGCNIVLYGHTHVPLRIAWGDVLIFNPGSISQPRGGARSSYGLIDIYGPEINGDIIEI